MVSRVFHDQAIVVEVVIGMSMLGSLFIIWSFAIFQRSKEAKGRPDIPLSSLVFCLGISDLMGSICWFVQGHVAGDVCRTFGYGSVFFSICSYMFSLCVSMAIYRLVCWKANIDRAGFIWYILLSLFVSTAFLGGIAGSGRITARLDGKEGCWFNRNDRSQLAYWDMPLLVAWCISLVLYSITYSKIRRMSTRKARRKVYVRLMLFALVFLPTVLPDLLVSILFAFGVITPRWLAYTVSLLAASRGFWDALVFGYNVEMEGKVAALLCGCTCCCSKSAAPKAYKEFKMTPQPSMIGHPSPGGSMRPGDRGDLLQPLNSGISINGNHQHSQPEGLLVSPSFTAEPKRDKSSVTRFPFETPSSWQSTGNYQPFSGSAPRNQPNF